MNFFAGIKLNKKSSTKFGEERGNMKRIESPYTAYIESR